MHFFLNLTEQRIEITAPNGFVVAFIEYRNFGTGYGYFAALLDNQNF
jgi:hypothetical protein